MKPRFNNPMLANERRAVFSLAGIFSLRMFGLFMLLPVLAIYGERLSGATPMLLGLALGIYGLTQAALQIPFGMLSDRIDRKKIIVFGLLIFSIGSVIAGLSDSIFGLIMGRAIQGAGAISAAIMALTADLTRSNQRTKAMAIIGITIGATFMLSIILSPLLQHFIGIQGLFWVIASLALFAIVVLLRVVPNAEITRSHQSKTSILGDLSTALRNKRLRLLNFGILVIHMVLTALFLVLPGLLVHKSGFGLENHWKFYAPVLVCSVIGMAPFVLAGSNSRWINLGYRVAIATLVLSFCFLVLSGNFGLPWLVFSMILFFSAFNALESLLPSLVSQVAPAHFRGTAIAVYNTHLFFGIFLGGLLGGIILTRYDAVGVFGFCVATTFILLIVAWMSPKFKLTTTKEFEIGHLNPSQHSQLIAKIEQLKGVEKVSIVSGETIAYLEVDEDVYDNTEIQQLIKT